MGKSRYGIPSRRMLRFLYDNPGATAREISEHLFDGRTVEQVLVEYRHSSKRYNVSHIDSLRTQWQPKQYVINSMMTSEWYDDVKILDERIQPVSKVCRGKFAYLTSPYCSRTLANDPEGRRTHPGSANRNGQRRWFYRQKHDGRYRYFLTLVGMGALQTHGLP